MDRKSVLGLVMIALLLIFWPFFIEWMEGDYTSSSDQKKPTADSISQISSIQKTTAVISVPNPIKKQDTVKSKEIRESYVTLRSEFFTMKLSSRGGGSIKKLILHKFKDPYGQDLVLIDGQKTLNLSFSFQGKQMNLGDAVFTQNFSDTLIDLEQASTKSLEFVFAMDGERRVVQTFTFTKNRYDFDLNVEFKNFGDDITGGDYQIQWRSSFNVTEKDRHGDLTYFKSYGMLGDEKEEFDNTETDKEASYNGLTRWVASRSKYFVLFIIPGEKDGIGCKFTGHNEFKDGAMTAKNNTTALIMKFEPNKPDAFKFFIGPMDYALLSTYNENITIILEWGWAVIRPLTKLILNTFIFLYGLIPNYGWVIIVFALLVKIVTYPLSYKTFTGMQKMKLVMPRQKEIQKKFKDNPTRMQQEMMKLYKEAGYNPLSGCLPMLIQIPLLFPIYQVFHETIDLRQAPFFGWIKDLSVPDTITTLHTGLPFLGDFNINPLPIIMTVLTFVQQKIAPMTPMTGNENDPAQAFNQKFMMYGMPILFFFLFNNFSSGLVLYWTIFNVLTMGQQLLMQRYVDVK